MKTNLLIATMILAATCCGASGELTPAERVNRRVAAMKADPASPSAEVLVRHAGNGGFDSYEVAVYKGCEYIVWDSHKAGGIIHAASCTNHAPTIVTNPCQRVHCDTPWPYRIVPNSGPYLAPNPVVSGNWHNLPTWPGTYSTNYVTNAANVEKEN